MKGNEMEWKTRPMLGAQRIYLQQLPHISMEEAVILEADADIPAIRAISTSSDILLWLHYVLLNGRHV
jgi:hypothetical protein